MERFAQFVSQLLLSALTEVMPDTSITTATVCVCVCVCKHAKKSVCASMKSMERIYVIDGAQKEVCWGQMCFTVISGQITTTQIT